MNDELQANDIPPLPAGCGSVDAPKRRFCEASAAGVIAILLAIVFPVRDMDGWVGHILDGDGPTALMVAACVLALIATFAYAFLIQTPMENPLRPILNRGRVVYYLVFTVSFATLLAIVFYLNSVVANLDVPLAEARNSTLENLLGWMYLLNIYFVLWGLLVLNRLPSLFRYKRAVLGRAHKETKPSASSSIGRAVDF